MFYYRQFHMSTKVGGCSGSLCYPTVATTSIGVTSSALALAPPAPAGAVCFFVSLFVCLLACLLAYLFMYLFIYLFIYF